jgi:lipoyl(octanoyl) transferase
MVDLARRTLTVRGLVRLLEQAVIDVLDRHGVAAERKPGAPGIYVGGAKIAALGLRVRRGCAYHGVALNVDMDLAPFADIDPCGYPGLRVTQTSALDVDADAELLGVLLATRIVFLLAEQR